MAETQTEQSTKALTARGQMLTTLNQRLSELEPKLGQLLPKFLPAKRFFLVAYDSVTRTPALQECTIPSILKCVIEGAEAGLEIGGPKKHAWMVPFRNRKTGKMEAQLIPGYMGLAHLCYDAGGVTKVEPHKVHARDHYVPPGGPDSPFEHVPYNEKCGTCGGAAEVTRVTKNKDKTENHTVTECPDCAGTGRESRGRIIAYYTVATLPNGSMTSCHMDRAEIQSIRARSKAKDSGPWVTDFDEMAIKTVFKRHEKFLPKSDGQGAERLARAIELDNQSVGLEEAENASAVETTSRPLPHEILDDDQPEDAEEVKPETKDSTEPKKDASSPEATPASCPSREPGDETENFQTEAEKAAAIAAETINPQRLDLLQKTAAAAGLDELQVSEILKPFGVGELEQVTNLMFSDVLAVFAKKPPKKVKK
jgi:recombination protein RecT